MQKQPDPRDLRYIQFVTDRLHGLEDTEIAAKWDLSPEDLYLQMSQAGYPVCSECGAAPVTGTHCESFPQYRRRRPRAGDGKSHELPRLDGAAALFEEAADALYEIIEDLAHYRLVVENGRFTNTWVDNETPTYFPRSSFTAEEWEKLCETHGHDANSRGFTLWGAGLKAPTGGSRYPPRPLVNLIAVYALLELDMSTLLKALHPDPSSVEEKRISGLIHKTKVADGRDGLVRTAEQLAELVCGGGGGRGAPASELSAREQNVACSITNYREEGWPDARIFRHYAPLGFSKERILELGRLGLRWPEE